MVSEKEKNNSISIYNVTLFFLTYYERPVVYYTLWAESLKVPYRSLDRNFVVRNVLQNTIIQH